MDPTRSLYTRTQMAELTGLDDAVLNYWSREGLMVPSQGGEGRGSHRKFDYHQINIAAILGQLRRFRLNIEVMGSFAAMLQDAVALGKRAQLHPSNVISAARLATSLHEFRDGAPVLIPRYLLEEEPEERLVGAAHTKWVTSERPAASEADVIKFRLGRSLDHDSVGTVLAAAEKMGPGKETISQIYAELVYDLVAPGYSGAYSWLLGFDPDDSWRIEFSHDGASFFDGMDSPSPETFGPGIFLPVSGIIRSIWGLKSPRAYMLDQRIDYLEGLLAKAGVSAKLRANDDEETFSISGEDSDWEKIREVLDRAGYRLGTKGELENEGGVA